MIIRIIQQNFFDLSLKKKKEFIINQVEESSFSRPDLSQIMSLVTWFAFFEKTEKILTQNLTHALSQTGDGKGKKEGEKISLRGLRGNFFLGHVWKRVFFCTHISNVGLFWFVLFFLFSRDSRERHASEREDVMIVKAFRHSLHTKKIRRRTWSQATAMVPFCAQQILQYCWGDKNSTRVGGQGWLLGLLCTLKN